MLSLQYIQQLVDLALEEDIGSGDITAALVQPDSIAKASVVSREAGVLCGSIFVDAVVLWISFLPYIRGLLFTLGTGHK